VDIRQLFLAEVGSSFHEAVIIERDAAPKSCFATRLRAHMKLRERGWVDISKALGSGSSDRQLPYRFRPLP
jgi:hypothetical protein